LRQELAQRAGLVDSPPSDSANKGCFEDNDLSQLLTKPPDLTAPL
jgi:hypothetical protein